MNANRFDHSRSALLLSLVGLVVSCSLECGVAQSCAPAITKHKTANAVRGKVGVTGCLPTTPPTYYLHQVTETIYDYASSSASGNVTADYDSTATLTIPRSPATDPNPNDHNPHLWQSASQTTYTGHATLNDTITPTNSCSANQASNGTWGTNDDCKTRVLSYFVQDNLQQTGCTLMERTETFSSHSDEHGLTVDVTMRRTTTVSEPYSDLMFRDDVLAMNPDYLPAGEQWSVGHGQASSTIDGDHIRGSITKMKYCFDLPDTEKDLTYRIEWDEITTHSPYGGPVRIEISHLNEEVEGTGNVATSSVHEVLPYFCTEPQGGDISITTANVSVSIAPKPGNNTSGNNTSAPTPGTGPRPSQGCTGCAGGYAGQFGNARAGGLWAEFSMGTGLRGLSAGSLTIAALKPSPLLSTTNLLRATVSRLDVEVVMQNNRVLQVKAPQALADVYVVDARFKYEIRYYLPSQVGTLQNGRYQVSGTPFVTWIVENPDTSGATWNELRVTERRPAVPEDKIYRYVYDSGAGTWKFIAPGDLFEEIVSDTARISNLRTVTVTLRTPNAPTTPDAFKARRTFKACTWGEVMTEEKLSPDANPRTTLYYYYDSPPFTVSGSLVPLKQIVRPDGSWEFYTYDDQGRKTGIYSGYGNQAAPAEGTVDPPDINTCRATLYSYSATDIAGSTDNVTQHTYSPRMTISKLLGQEISRSYLVILPNERREIQCQSRGAAWSATDNLVTKTKYYSSGLNVNRVESIENPDGTMTFCTYAPSGNGETETVFTGEPNAGKTAIAAGTKTVTLTDGLGQVVSRYVYDLPENTIALSSEAYSNPDDFGRLRTVAYLDNTQSTVNTGCCGAESSVDRDGVLTEYKYDGAHRLTTTKRLGISITNKLDAAGRVLQTYRIVTGQDPMILQQFEYDASGMVTKETNALNGVTQYAESYAGNHRTRTTTYPDGGTRIENYFTDGTLKELTGTAVFPVSYEYNVESDGQVLNAYAKEVKLNSLNQEWTKTYTDLVGRPYLTVYPDGAWRRSYFNSKGQLWKERDPDDVITLYHYDAKGERDYTILAVLNTTRTLANYDALCTSIANSTFLGGGDRITKVVRSVVSGTPPMVRTDTYVWKDGQSDASRVSRSEVSTHGLQSSQTVWRQAGNDSTKAVTQSVTLPEPGIQKRTITVTAPDGTQTVSIYGNGRLTSVTRKDNTAGHNPVTSTTYGYDDFGRQTSVIDWRNGETTLLYNNADQVTTSTSPDPGTGRQATITYYDNLGRVNGVKHHDGTAVTNFYLATGLLQKTYGSRTYPVEYTYDAQGRMRTMTTWSGFNSVTGTGTGARVTTWNYDEQRGWLRSKYYPNPNDGTPGTTGTAYEYTAGGRLKKRTWARSGNNGQPIFTTYSYGFDDGVNDNQHGDLTKVEYSANDPVGTPAITYGYDRLGRRSQASRAGTTTVLAYNDANQAVSEACSGGTLGGFTVSSAFNNSLQRESLSLGGVAYSASYGYDSAGRLGTAAQGGSVMTCSYVDRSLLVGQITHAHNSVTRMTTTKQHDSLNRLQSISSVSAGPALATAYLYNAANQRYRATLADGAYWVYTYDALGQVTSGKKYWSDGTLVAGQQFEYNFDSIGNRSGDNGAKTGGDGSGNNLRSQNYTAGYLNQYSSRTVPGYVQMLGTAGSGAKVTLWNEDGSYALTSRKSDYFWGELSLNNNSSALYKTITTWGVANNGSNPDIVGSSSGKVFVPKTPELYDDPSTPTVNEGYDADGNQLRDGRWNYTWDAENRLIKVESHSTGPTGSKRRLEFAYDFQGRRIWAKVTNLDTSTVLSENKFLYDGWNVVAELNAANHAIIRSYVWGSDLSGSMQGAGGVGGLLKLTYNGTQPTNCFVAYDGNGNVSGLVDAANGSVIAQYEYGPFGEVIRATGPMAKANPFRFSTKYQDDETDLLYYGYRYYNASTGRWVSRDPAQEKGGRNLYAFARNQPISRLDPDGRADIETPTICPKCGQSVNPLNGACGCAGPPAPKIDCSGYKNMWPSSCTSCRGTRGEDFYPKRAYVVCEAFAKQFTGTDLQGAASCVADCLIKAEARIQKADSSCDDRNCNRLTAHVLCYAKCRFTPNPFNLPPGADVVGWGDLLPAACRKFNEPTRFDRP